MMGLDWTEHGEYIGSSVIGLVSSASEVRTPELGTR